MLKNLTLAELFVSWFLDMCAQGSGARHGIVNFRAHTVDDRTDLRLMKSHFCKLIIILSVVIAFGGSYDLPPSLERAHGFW